MHPTYPQRPLPPPLRPASPTEQLSAAPTASKSSQLVAVLVTCYYSVLSLVLSISLSLVCSLSHQSERFFFFWSVWLDVTHPPVLRCVVLFVVSCALLGVVLCYVMLCCCHSWYWTFIFFSSYVCKTFLCVAFLWVNENAFICVYEFCLNILLTW